MWVCFNRLGVWGKPLSTAIFGEVIQVDQESRMLIRAPFPDGTRDIVFMADGQRLGHWKKDGSDGDDGRFVITAVAPEMPIPERQRIDPDGITTLTTKFYPGASM